MQQPTERCDALPPSTDHAARIEDEAAWIRLASRPTYNPAARTEVVKLVIDLEDGERLYFIDSRRWSLHYYFIRRYIDANLDHATFNITQYRRPERRFVLATLTRWLDVGVHTFELVAGDTLAPERILRAFEQTRAQVYFGEALRYRPTGPQHEEAVRALGGRLPYVTPDSVYASLRYQPLVGGVAYGYLRRLRAPLELSALRPNDIVLTDEVPEALSPVAALVTSRMQAPLAHVAVLCRNRGTPDMALREAFDDPRFTALEGELVRLEVSPQEFTITRAERHQAEAAWAAQRPARVQTPALDLREPRLRAVSTLRLRDVERYGAKAAQLGEVEAIGDVRTPGGFAIPFSRYASHLSRAGLEEVVRTLVQEEARGALQERALAERLADLRARIERAPVDEALLRELTTRLAQTRGRKHILRSSTNAEDLVGFNGAGLYESVVIPANASDAQVADALRRVWSSVWLERAYAERSWYRIAHAQVAMGVLVQPFVDEVVGKGVAVTVNPFDEARPGVLINVQTEEGSVTGAGSDELPEQFLVYTWSDVYEPELLTRSSRTGGAPILSNEDVLRLTSILETIHTHMQPFYGAGANGIDVEFVLTRRGREFVIVQARPYNVVYEASQTFARP